MGQRPTNDLKGDIMEYKDPGRYIPIIYLLYSWGSLFGVPSRVPLKLGSSQSMYHIPAGTQYIAATEPPHACRRKRLDDVRIVVCDALVGSV